MEKEDLRSKKVPLLKSGVIGLQVFEFMGEKGKEDWIRVAGT
jgi:hypothetical protein